MLELHLQASPYLLDLLLLHLHVCCAVCIICFWRFVVMRMISVSSAAAFAQKVVFGVAAGAVATAFVMVPYLLWPF